MWFLCDSTLVMRLTPFLELLPPPLKPQGLPYPSPLSFCKVRFLCPFYPPVFAQLRLGSTSLFPPHLLLLGDRPTHVFVPSSTFFHFERSLYLEILNILLPPRVLSPAAAVPPFGLPLFTAHLRFCLARCFPARCFRRSASPPLLRHFSSKSPPPCVLLLLFFLSEEPTECLGCNLVRAIFSRRLPPSLL